MGENIILFGHVFTTHFVPGYCMDNVICQLRKMMVLD